MKKILTTMLVALTVTALGVLTAAPTQARTAWDTSPVYVTRHVTPTPRVVDLRVGQHATYDRVVIDLSGRLPGYDVRYVSSLHYDPSGARVPLRGARFIRVALTPATGHDAQGRSVYRGPDLEQYAMPTLRGAAFIGDDEGVVSFGLALSHLEGFRVIELSAPSRLVIDLHH